MSLEMNFKTINRVKHAHKKLYTLARRAKKLTEDERVALYQKARYIFDQFELYCHKNAGTMPPSDAHLWFKHAETTLQYISKASTDIRKLWKLIPPSKQAEANGAHVVIVQMLKDLATHVRAQMKREGK